jgi:hypothetical protein
VIDPWPDFSYASEGVCETAVVDDLLGPEHLKYQKVSLQAANQSSQDLLHAEIGEVSDVQRKDGEGLVDG